MATIIETVEELETKLQEDLAWRKKEMLSIKMMADKGDANESILLRSGITMLCAHFEGFVKLASNCYVKYVSAQKINNCLLKDNFMAYSLTNAIKQCSNTEKISVYQKVIDKVRGIYDVPFCVKKDVISTHSNPSSTELKEIVASIGLETDIFDLKANYIDSNLLNNRHKVVHGERYPIDKEDFRKTFEVIMGLIEQYEELIVQAADEKKFMKESND